jgi:hypothetical protein
LETIGATSFNNCSSLTECVFYAADPPALGTSALANTNSELQIQAPAASVAAYKAAWSAFADKIIPIGE